MRPTLRIVTPPSENDLVVSLSDAKDHLGVESTDHDAKIYRMIRAATERLAYMGRALLPATYVWGLWGFDDRPYRITYRPLDLPMPPLLELLSVRIANVTDPIDPSTYIVEVDYTGRAKISPIRGTRWPTVPWAANSVSIEFRAGYDGVTWKMPDAIVSAILIIVEGLFENRSEYTPGTMGRLPDAIDNLLGDLRVFNL